MFVVDQVLISDDVVQAAFCCSLGACKGACCVVGESGAPLEESELTEIEAILPHIKDRLRDEALAVIEKDGAWEEITPGYYATTCVDDSECVFVRYDGLIAKCAIQEAYQEGKISFEKPISCHLFPLRAEQLGEYESLNYEQVEICKPAITHGESTATYLAEYLEKPLVRKYGSEWYREFMVMVRERREFLATDESPVAPNQST
jgi:hypothetical protein